jgi:hypothetical protein
MRDLLRTYAFVPSPCPAHGQAADAHAHDDHHPFPGAGAADVFEDWVGGDDEGDDDDDDGLEALVIDAPPESPGPAWLVEARILAAPARGVGDPALLARRARVVWLVRGGGPPAGGAAPSIVVVAPGVDDKATRAMDPAAEAAAAARVGGLCAALAARLEAEAAKAAATAAAAPTQPAATGWLAREHARLAREYVAARAALLRWAAAGLEVQAGWIGREAPVR